MAVMEYCKPMGRPIISSRAAYRLSGRRSSRLRRSTGKLRAMYHRHSSPEISWLSRVAQPAPATPIRKPTMNSTSSAPFSRLD